MMSPREPDPLRSALYLKRNFRQLLPVLLILALATSLLVLVLTPTNTFRRTHQANLHSLDYFTIVSPLLEKDFSPALLQILDFNPDMERRIPVKVFWVRYPMLVGEAFCPLILVEEEELPAMMERLGVELEDGRVPRKNSPEVIMHRNVAAARGLDMGDWFGAAVDPDDATPGKYQVVGLFGGEARLALGDYEHSSSPTYITSRSGDFQMVFARSGRKAESDYYLNFVKRDGDLILQVINADYVQNRIDKALRNLPLMKRFIAAAAASIVALVIALLNVIVFRSRICEYGILVAIGRKRGRLLRKLATETAMLGLLGWVVGLALGYAGLALYNHLAFVPRGIIVDVGDLTAVWITAVLPVVSVAASFLALNRQLRKVDPIAILQGRWE